MRCERAARPCTPRRGPRSAACPSAASSSPAARRAGRRQARPRRSRKAPAPQLRSCKRSCSVMSQPSWPDYRHQRHPRACASVTGARQCPLTAPLSHCSAPPPLSASRSACQGAARRSPRRGCTAAAATAGSCSRARCVTCPQRVAANGDVDLGADDAVRGEIARLQHPVVLAALASNASASTFLKSSFMRPPISTGRLAELQVVEVAQRAAR